MSFRTFVPRFVPLVSLVAAAHAAAFARPEPAGGPPRVGTHAEREAPFSRAAADPWLRLRPRMTKGDVLRLLGVPPWRDRTLLFEFWMYEVESVLASGVIVFEKDHVFSWRPPSDAPGRP